ncbi:site-specific integrase [Heliobacterium chlorum]|uniref:Site-specific integrase n=1 Tax=Heliobacterium chlorum TaxID=2698 RepID=A0ABR7T906_HELCL|nr:site-specific integrase [Heliobacterium chlorum]MBC9786429.1 site-specific integrase [Heliobacterium chlorum]
MTSQRNKPGQGSVYQRKDGYFVAQVHIGQDDNGKPKYARKTFKAESDALIWRDKAIVEYRLGTFIIPSTITLGEWMDIWLEQYARPNVRPKTYECYEYITRLHLKPKLGNVKIQSLQTTQLQRLLNEKRQSGLATRTVELILTTARTALKQAMHDELINKNAADHVRKPKPSPKQISVFTVDQMKEFMFVAEEDRLWIAFKLLLGTGMRVGELLALKWGDINLERGHIDVTKGTVLVKNEHGPNKTHQIIQEPKTKNGYRRIPITEDLVRQLKRWHFLQFFEKKNAEGKYEDSGLVVTTKKGRMVTQRNLATKFHRLLAKAEIPKTNLHSLRHTYATRLLEAGVHPKVVQELLGHGSIRITLDTYSHVLPDVKKQAIDKIEGMLSPRKMGRVWV